MAGENLAGLQQLGYLPKSIISFYLILSQPKSHRLNFCLLGHFCVKKNDLTIRGSAACLQICRNEKKTTPQQLLAFNVKKTLHFPGGASGSYQLSLFSHSYIK